MSGRALPFLCFLICGVSFGCAKPIETGQTCFDTSECRTGVCATTVYGKVCLNTCSIDIVRCEFGEACLLGEEIPAGLDGGVDGGADGGLDGGVVDAGLDGGTESWFCLPANLATAPPSVQPDGIPPQGLCTYSLDCFRGGVCVCVEGQDCDLENEDRTGPICQEICNSGTVNQCPNDQPCVDLGMGRGFCDSYTEPPI